VNTDRVWTGQSVTKIKGDSEELVDVSHREEVDGEGQHSPTLTEG